MFTKVLIANRGEIACRVIRTLRRMGVGSVAVYSEPDANALHVRDADESVLLGPAPVAESYLRADKIIAAAKQTGAQAIHPGYGFLSENADFATACAAAGLRFIGPTPDQIRRFGLKHLAREVAVAQGVPLLPGTGLLTDVEHARREAARIGYPVMCKSTAGGGGIGLAICRDEAALTEAFATVQRLSKQNFDDGGAYLERYLEAARHVEVQIFGDGRGGVLALGERDCSTQRRNQKVIEEAPAPGLRPEVRQALHQAAVRMGQAVAYASAGTVEFVVDARTQELFFLEVNTRLQVEHGVTEEVTGVDLVEWMIRQAAGDWALPAQAPDGAGRGHRGARLRRGSRPRVPAQHRPPDRGRPAGRRHRPLRRLDRIRPGGDPPLRSAAGEGGRPPAPIAPRRWAAWPRRWRRRRSTASRPTSATCGRCWPIHRSSRATCAPACSRISVFPPPPSRCWTAEPRPPSRTGPGGWVCGRSACRLRAPWTIWRSAWPTGWWAILWARRRWRSP